MIRPYTSYAIGFIALLYFPSSEALSLDDLSSQAPQCKMTTAKRPRLPAEMDGDLKITADFNGDNWCDFALQIPYPSNSQMESYYLNQILELGGPTGWRQPFKGRKPYLPPISSLDGHIWPIFQVDLTNIAFVYRKLGGAPYVIGIMNGYELPKTIVNPDTGCQQYAVVHRWDDNVDGLKKVDDATRDVVLSFYYSRVEKPCNQLAKEQAGGDSASK